MRLFFLTVWSLLISGLSYGQVGIDTSAPQATLDVAAKKGVVAGIIAPRLTGDEIKAADTKYGTDQIGAIVYATAPVNNASSKTNNITKKGYYYFNGIVWEAFVYLSGDTFFVPYVAVSARSDVSTSHTDGTAFTAWTFTADTNDGNWDGSAYHAPKTGFYQFSLRAKVEASSTNNSFQWMITLSPSSGSSYSYELMHRKHVALADKTSGGGTVVLSLTAGTKVEFGGVPCSGCAGTTYNVTDRACSITYLGL
ncbi:MAG: hypothetical protein ACK5MD_00305 [Flavobacteriales bacterium]